jgi:hypothetical protein
MPYKTATRKEPQEQSLEPREWAGYELYDPLESPSLVVMLAGRKGRAVGAKRNASYPRHSAPPDISKRPKPLTVRPRPIRLMLAGCCYLRRSLRSPFFSLALPLLWSERPSRFLPLSPLKAPPASFTRPLALSITPSFLSSLLLLPGTLSAPLLDFCFTTCTVRHNARGNGYTLPRSPGGRLQTDGPELLI